jgi:hypothetical protein
MKSKRVNKDNYVDRLLVDMEAVTEYKGVNLQKMVASPIISSLVAEDLGILKLTVDAVIDQWLIHIFTQVKAGNEVNFKGLCSFKPVPKKLLDQGFKKGEMKFELKPLVKLWMKDLEYYAKDGKPKEKKPKA